MFNGNACVVLIKIDGDKARAAEGLSRALQIPSPMAGQIVGKIPVVLIDKIDVESARLAVSRMKRMLPEYVHLSAAQSPADGMAIPRLKWPAVPAIATPEGISEAVEVFDALPADAAHAAPVARPADDDDLDLDALLDDEPVVAPVRTASAPPPVAPAPVRTDPAPAADEPDLALDDEDDAPVAPAGTVDEEDEGLISMEGPSIEYTDTGTKVEEFEVDPRVMFARPLVRPDIKGSRKVPFAKPVAEVPEVSAEAVEVAEDMEEPEPVAEEPELVAEVDEVEEMSAVEAEEIVVGEADEVLEDVAEIEEIDVAPEPVGIGDVSTRDDDLEADVPLVGEEAGYAAPEPISDEQTESVSAIEEVEVDAEDEVVADGPVETEPVGADDERDEHEEIILTDRETGEDVSVPTVDIDDDDEMAVEAESGAETDDVVVDDEGADDGSFGDREEYVAVEDDADEVSDEAFGEVATDDERSAFAADVDEASLSEGERAEEYAAEAGGEYADEGERDDGSFGTGEGENAGSEEEFAEPDDARDGAETPDDEERIEFDELSKIAASVRAIETDGSNTARIVLRKEDGEVLHIEIDSRSSARLRAVFSGGARSEADGVAEVPEAGAFAVSDDEGADTGTVVAGSSDGAISGRKAAKGAKKKVAARPDKFPKGLYNIVVPRNRIKKKKELNDFLVAEFSMTDEEVRTLTAPPVTVIARMVDEKEAGRLSAILKSIKTEPIVAPYTGDGGGGFSAGGSETGEPAGDVVAFSENADEPADFAERTEDGDAADGDEFAGSANEDVPEMSPVESDEEDYDEGVDVPDVESFGDDVPDAAPVADDEAEEDEEDFDDRVAVEIEVDVDSDGDDAATVGPATEADEWAEGDEAEEDGDRE